MLRLVKFVLASVLTVVVVAFAVFMIYGTVKSNSDNNEERNGQVPVVINIYGLQARASENSIKQNILQQLQSKAPQNVKFVEVSSGKQWGANTLYAFTVNYSEQPYNKYYYDNSGYLRLAGYENGYYDGTQVKCSIEVNGKYNIGDGKIYLEAATSEFLSVPSEKDAERQLRESAVGNLWAQFVQLPGYWFRDSVPQGNELLKYGPFDVRNAGSTETGWTTISSNPALAGIGQTDYYTTAIIYDIADGYAYLSEPNGTNTDYHGINIFTGVSWNLSVHFSAEFYYDQIVVDNGVAYLFGDNIFAVDAKTGEIKWEHEALPNKSVRFNAIDDDTLYYGTNTICTVDIHSGDTKWFREGFKNPRKSLIGDGVVIGTSSSSDIFALDSNTGEKLWEHKLESSRYHFGEYYGDPILADGRVYALTYSKYNGTSYGGRFLCAYDALTGTEIWAASLPTLDSTYDSYQIIIPDNRTIIVDDVCDVSAFNVEGGGLIWRYHRECVGPMVKSTVGQKTIVIADGIMAHALDISTGKERWVLQYDWDDRVVSGVNSKCATTGGYFRNVSISDERVYIDCRNGSYCVNEQTGEEIWYAGFELGKVSDGIVYSREGAYGSTYAAALDARSGQLLWCREIAPEKDFFTAIIDNGIYYSTVIEHPTSTTRKAYLLVLSPN